MEGGTESSLLEHFTRVMGKHRVEFLVIGGQAEVLYGSSRVTFDVDFCYRRTSENLEKLAAALLELKPTLRGAPPDLPFRIDAQSLALGSNFTFSTAHGDLDLLGWVEPLGEYEAFASRASVVRLGEMDVRVIAIDDLITIKRHLGRPKDREALRQLEAIRRVQRDSTP
jgi:hypothetical protein